MSASRPITDIAMGTHERRFVLGAAFQLTASTTRERRCSLSHRARRASNFSDWRRVPLAGERVRLWTVETHRQIEWPLRRGKPIGLLVRTRAFILKVEVKRAIGII